MAEQQPMVVVLTGLAGAGRSTAAKALEDLGFFVIDNLPPKLLGRAAELADVADETGARLAVAIDSRSGLLTFSELENELLHLERDGVRTLTVFLDADDLALVHRYQENRRPHPVRAATLEESIATERKLLADVRGNADVLIDTTDLNVHDLRRRLQEAFEAPTPRRQMKVTVASFGFKHGSPRDLDLVFDVRFLPNPHWVPELRPLTGIDAAVADYVLKDEAAMEFVERIDGLLEFLVPRYVDEGKAYLRIGIGCTGGRHRSVAIAEELGRRLGEAGNDVTVRHRDSGI
ncbi:MAG: RNase adapter RapZ [Acidimicrobiia bacterium]|nr:RNase adapter RapZ [Acidimicrobiia bacterium]